MIEEGVVLLFAIGSMVDTAMEARDILKDFGIEVAVCNARFAKPLDTEYLKQASKRYKTIVTLEENAKIGGFGEHVLACLHEMDYEGHCEIVGIPDKFIQHGAVDVLKEKLGIDAKGVAQRVMDILN